MPRVCVVGGGTSGTEAAREAARRGADVVVLEKRESRAPPWRTWPALIDSKADSTNLAKPRQPDDSRVVRTEGLEVKSVCRNVALSADGSATRFDSVVIATGTAFEPVRFPGTRKAGVLVLDSPEQYEELGRKGDFITEAVVLGEGGRGLEVSEKLSERGAKVHLHVSSWQHSRPSSDVQAILVEALSRKGISLLAGILEGAVGSGAVEAVISGGRVVSCECLAIVPRRIPTEVPSPASHGPRGGLLVDRALRASSPSTYAAGGCAELGVNLQPTSTLEDEGATSGRIAGANATGRALSIGTQRFSEICVLRLRWTRIWADQSYRGYSGPPLGVFSRRWSPTSACTVVFEKPSARVVGIETIEEEGASRVGNPLALSKVPSLTALAYESLDSSSDISLVSDTARLALAQWSKY